MHMSSNAAGKSLKLAIASKSTLGETVFFRTLTNDKKVKKGGTYF